HTELRQGAGVGPGELGRVLDRPDADDGGLAGHQAGHGGEGADGAGIGDGDGGAGEVVGLEAAGADLADQVLVGGEEGAEVERLGQADVRHQQAAGPVRLLHVDGKAQVDVRAADDVRPAIDLAVDRVHGGDRGESPR